MVRAYALEWIIYGAKTSGAARGRDGAATVALVPEWLRKLPTFPVMPA